LSILVRLLRLLRPHLGGVAITAGAAAGLMACSITLPYLTGVVVDEVLRDGRESLLLPLVALYLAIVLLRMGLAYVRRTVSGTVSLGVEVDLRDRMFAHLSRLSFGFFDRQPVGQLMSRATSDLQTVRFFLGYGLIFLFMHLFTLAIVAVILFAIHPGLAALSLAIGPVLLVVAWRYSRRSNPILLDVQQKIGEVAELAEESAVGIRVIKAFGQEAQLTDRFAGRARTAFDRSMDANQLQSFYQPLMGFLPVVGLAVVLAYGGSLVIDGALSLGELTSFYLYLTLLMFPFRSVGMLIGNALRAVAGGRRIFEVLDAPVEVRERPDALPLPAGDGHVRLVGVTFRYDGSARSTLRDVNLELAPGETVALIGATGSGKSTLAQLIPRYYDPEAGRVELDGADVRDLRLDDLRRAVGVVSQEPFLFSTTIRENIAFGRPGATDDQVREVARLAQAHRFIEELPDGYDTVVGERGYTLSGGQRQRIAIARAVITDPRVLILDEATASVDASTEREIQDALRAATRGRTTLIIAHRHSTIALADRIAVLDGGGVIATGTHDELLADSETYREIYESGLARPELIAPPA
jgi:ABC-type multidrug transport system fused ATPase/permease subunit